MDSARDKATGQIVSAEDLWAIENIEEQGYVCRGCGIPAIPASYRPKNLVRAHFRFRQDHKYGCDVGGEIELIAKGRKNRLSTPRDGFPAPYPSSLKLLGPRPKVDPMLPIIDNEVKQGARKPPEEVPTDDNTSMRKRNWAANTIRPICKDFVNFPYDRDRELSIDGIEGSNYLTIFKKLCWDKLIRYQSKLLYAPICWVKPIETDACLEIAFDAGERKDKKLLHGYKVRVDWSNWSVFKQRSVRTEIEVARQEAINAGNEKKNDKAYFFFIGTQDAQEEAVFHVTDHRLLCCIVTSIIYPDYKEKKPTEKLSTPRSHKIPRKVLHGWR